MNSKIFNIIFIIAFGYFLIWNSQSHKNEILKKNEQEELLKKENLKLLNSISNLQKDIKLVHASLIAVKNENSTLKNDLTITHKENNEIKDKVLKEKEKLEIELVELKNAQKEMQKQSEILLNQQIILNQDLTLKNSEIQKENDFLKKQNTLLESELKQKSVLKNVIIEEKLKPLIDKGLEIKSSEKVNPIQPYKPSFWTRLKKYIKRKLFPNKQIVLNQKKYSDIEAKQIYEKNIIQAKKDFIPSKVINFYLLCKENKIKNTQLSETENSEYWIKDLIFLDTSGTIILTLKINKKIPPQLENGYQFNAEVTFNDLPVISFTGHLDLTKDPQWFDIDVLSYIPGLWINGINQNLNNEF